MKTKNKFKSLAFTLLFGLLVLGTSAAADILDEEEPVVTPKTPAQDPTQPPAKPDVKPTPAPPGKRAIGDKDEKKPLQTPASAKDSEKKPSKPATKMDPGKKGDQPSEPVHFESKGLRGMRDKGTVELIEDVVVTQGELRLEAERAQIFYDENNKEVVKVVATGNVKMNNVDKSTGEKMQAYCNEVTFLNSERTVIMEGNARLWRGTQHVIRSKKITYEIDTGWIKADRVAGELQPEDAKK